MSCIIDGFVFTVGHVGTWDMWGQTERSTSDSTRLQALSKARTKSHYRLREIFAVIAQSRWRQQPQVTGRPCLLNTRDKL
jgi:hypothetical protein